MALSKALHDIYKVLELENIREGDESQTGMNKSELNNESEAESITTNARDHIIRTDNQAFEFEPINVAAVGRSNPGQH